MCYTNFRRCGLSWPLMLLGSPRALPWSTLIPVLQRSKFKPSSLFSSFHSFPYQTLHSLQIIWPPNSQKRTKIRLEHSKPPSPLMPLRQIHRYVCIPAQPSRLLQRRKGPPLLCWILIPPVTSDTLILQLSPSLLYFSTPLSRVLPSYQHLHESLSSYNAVFFNPTAWYPTAFLSIHLGSSSPLSDLLKELCALTTPFPHLLILQPITPDRCSHPSPDSLCC